jgi:hypothetical protein
MEEEEKSKGFKVEDRRRFSAEGELKPEFKNEATEATPQPSGEASKAFGSAERAPESQRAEAQAPSAWQVPPEMTFASFIVGLSTQALVHLGEVQDPTQGPTAVDLAAAQQLIDILGMLKEKTRGNLDKQEQGLIDAILFELQMKYVEKTRSS